jgi:putative transcriptional regulator
VVPAEEEDPLTPDPEGLWQRVLHRQGGVFSVLSRFPVDPSWN